MKIAIIGAGFTGLSAGFKLSEKGNEVTIFESNSFPGGLAIGFKEKKWKWSLEEHYHHLFKTDYAIQDLARKVGHNILFKRPKTSTYFKGEISQIDSPINLMKFKHLSFIDRLRTGITLAYLKATNSWQELEQKKAYKFLITRMGKNSWRVLWQPLLEKKFGKYSKEIPASWFWARVKSRTASLGYPEGGFKNLAEKIEKRIIENKSNIFYGTRVESIEKRKNKLVIKTSTNEAFEFDKVICTLPTNLFTKITKGLPKKYLNQIKNLHGLGAINLVLILDKSFLTDGTYWLNVNEKEFPFLCVVEHTNFMESKKYSGQKIIYIGNYLEKDHDYFKFSAKQILDEYFNHLKKINSKFRKQDVKKSYIFKAPFAQPIVTKNYSKTIPSIQTPIKGLYLANIQQVYPWDRGTNYAVELGNKVADILISEK